MAHKKSVSELLCISERTIWRYIRKFQQSGEVRPAKRSNGPQKLLGNFEQLILLRLILHNPSIYLHEIQYKLNTMFGCTVSLTTISRTLHHMGCTRQVIRHIALQRSDNLRAKFMADVSIYNLDMLIWIDESGCDRAIRKYGYSLRGMCPVDHRLLVRGIRYSTIPIMSTQGIHDVYLAEGTINRDNYIGFHIFFQLLRYRY